MNTRVEGRARFGRQGAGVGGSARVWMRSRVRSSEREHTGEGGDDYHITEVEGRGRSREGRRGHSSMEMADAERVGRGDPGRRMSRTRDLGRRMSPSMENAGSGAEDVADADLRETAGIAGEMRVGRGEMAHATAWARRRWRARWRGRGMDGRVSR
jgi:hypothetical protein